MRAQGTGLVVLLGLAAVPAGFVEAAERAAIPTEEDFFQELPVVLSGSRLKQTVAQSPVAVTVIDRQMIETSGAREIPELLRLVPGFIVGHKSGNDPHVTYNAISEPFSRRMQVMVDGRSVYTPTFGGVPWPSLALDINDIERIEVIRGPNAAAFGANAFLGTISIITRDPASLAGDSVEMVSGSDGIHKLLARSYGHSGRLGFRLTASTSGDDGLNMLEGEADGKSTDMINGRLDFRQANGSEWNVRFGGTSGKREEGKPGNPLGPVRDKDVSTNFQMLQWRSGPDPDDRTEVTFYRHREDIDEVYSTDPLPFLGGLRVPVDESLRSTRYDLELQQTSRIFDPLRLVWGASARRDEVHSPSFLGRDEPITNDLFRAFAHAEWKTTESVTTSIGVMLEDNDISGSDVSPRLAVNYALTPNDTVRFSASRATRTPVILEEFADQRFTVDTPIGTVFDQILVSTDDLDSETIESYEIGYVARFPTLDLNLDSRIYYDQLEGLIVPRIVPFPDPVNGFAVDFRNFDSTTIKGGEFRLDWSPRRDTRMVLNYSYTSIESTDVDEVYSESGPRHNTSLLVSHDITDRIVGSIAYYNMSPFDALDTGDLIGRTDRTDLKLGYRLGNDTNPGEIFLVIQSAFGSYLDYDRLNRFDRRIFGGVTVPF